MEMSKFCKTGAYHLKNGEVCQDKAGYFETKDYVIAVIADGVTACEKSDEGADIICRAFISFVLDEQENVFVYSKEKLAYLMIEYLLYCLEIETAKKGDAIQEYASTIAGVVVDRRNRKAVIINLGDGAVFTFSSSRMLEQLEPKRINGKPCLVTTKESYKAAEIKRLEVKFGEGLFLCTDGFIEILERRGKDLDAKELIVGYDFSRLQMKLQLHDTMDDCSYIAIW